MRPAANEVAARERAEQQIDVKQFKRGFLGNGAQRPSPEKVNPKDPMPHERAPKAPPPPEPAQVHVKPGR